jgi:hypothetical protein
MESSSPNAPKMPNAVVAIWDGKKILASWLVQEPDSRVRF